MANVGSFATGMYNSALAFVNATGVGVANKQSFAATGTIGTRIMQLICQSTDSATRDVMIGITISATNYDLGIVQIPITAGSVDTVPSIFYFSTAQFSGLPMDAFGNRYIDVANGNTLYAYIVTTAVTTAKQINILAIGGNI